MADNRAALRWGYVAVYVAIGLILIFSHLLPLGTMPTKWVGPDVFAALTMAWILRRPDDLPLIVIAALALLADLLFQRPPGLWAAIMVGLSDFLRRREEGLREAPFPVEWGAIALAFAAAHLLYRLVLALFMVQAAPLSLTLTQLILTITAYPLVVLALNYIIGVRRAAPGEVDALGHKR